MSYTALYRKWRPNSFDEVKGQDAIVTTLKNQIKTGRIGHAYLFCGTRGTGKISVAKLFARAVNCENPQDGSPCGECESCRSILAGSAMSVVEIDAASNNGVDNIREIRDEVQYSPTDGKYRVYIIDEVHMLSTGAFNALLKTLEEPPSYVIFILATTEPNKIPITVLSRCQRYDFHRITSDIIYDRLKEMTDAEGVEVEEKALRFVARKGDGSLRDAISLLDRCIAFYYGKNLTFDRVLEVLGAVNTDLYSRLLRFSMAGDAVESLKLVEQIASDGRDMSQFAADFVWYLRNLMLLKASEGEEDALEMSSEDMAALKEEAEIAEMGTIMRYIRLFSDLTNQMRFAANKRVLLEMAVIRLCRPDMEKEMDALLQRIERLELAVKNGAAAVREIPGGQENAAGIMREEAAKQEEKEPRVVTLEPAVFSDYQTVVQNWRHMLREIGGILYPTLADCEVEPQENSGMFLRFSDPGKFKIGGRPEKLAVLENYVAQNYGKQIHFSAGLRTEKGSDPVTYVSREEAEEKILMDIETEEE